MNKNEHYFNCEILEIMDTQVISDKFKKREFIIEEVDGNPDYPQPIVVEFTQDKVDKLDNFKAGDLVTVKFNHRGKRWEYTGGKVRYFNTLQAWYIAKSDNGNEAAQVAPMTMQQIDDDLPF